MNSEKSKKMNIEYRLGTKQDLNAICSLIQQAIDEMEENTTSIHQVMNTPF